MFLFKISNKSCIEYEKKERIRFCYNPLILINSSPRLSPTNWLTSMSWMCWNSLLSLCSSFQFLSQQTKELLGFPIQMTVSRLLRTISTLSNHCFSFCKNLYIFINRKYLAELICETNCSLLLTTAHWFVYLNIYPLSSFHFLNLPFSLLPFLLVAPCLCVSFSVPLVFLNRISGVSIRMY